MTLDLDKMDGLTKDSVFDGRLSLLQPRKGYRLSVDALLLTFFVCTGKRAKRAVDFGCGCGVVGLGLLLAEQVVSVVGVEIQPRLADIARRNSELNRLKDRFRLLESDIRVCPEALRHEAVDLVVANPPFWPDVEGRTPLDKERRVACHEIYGDIFEWTAAAAGLMNRKRSRFALVYPARRLGDLFNALRKARLLATRLRMVHSRMDRSAELVLLEARPGIRGPLEVEPAIVMQEDDGSDSPLASAIAKGEFSSNLHAVENMGGKS
jgi:tRNA1Val (adenine37-N6)-methyltransferase